MSGSSLMASVVVVSLPARRMKRMLSATDETSKPNRRSGRPKSGLTPSVPSMTTPSMIWNSSSSPPRPSERSAPWETMLAPVSPGSGAGSARSAVRVVQASPSELTSTTSCASPGVSWTSPHSGLSPPAGSASAASVLCSESATYALPSVARTRSPAP